MFAWFATPADAVRATEVLLGEFEHGRLHGGRVPMRIRAGLALGSPLSREDGDLFGMTVIEAARCAARPATVRGWHRQRWHRQPNASWLPSAG